LRDFEPKRINYTDDTDNGSSDAYTGDNICDHDAAKSDGGDGIHSHKRLLRHEALLQFLFAGNRSAHLPRRYSVEL
jgi:hypothetical protein